MMLIKRNRVWHYQTKIDGRTFRRSTSETARRRAEAVARKIEAEARLRRRQPSDWLRLSHAMKREVARIETDISSRQAERALNTFTGFLRWMGRDPDITEITHDCWRTSNDTGLRLSLWLQRTRTLTSSSACYGKMAFTSPSLHPRPAGKQRCAPSRARNLCFSLTTLPTTIARHTPRSWSLALGQRN